MSINYNILSFNGNYLSFDVVGSASFDPSITNATVGKWDFGDGTTQEANSVTKVYPNTNTYHVTYQNRNLSKTTSLYMANDGITGVLDLSKLNLITGIFLDSNSGLTSIIFPKASSTITGITVNSCNITGNLDMSGLSGLGGNFHVYNNPNLTSITNPSSINSMTEYYAYLCNLTGTLDLSGLSNLNRDIRIYANSNLTSIINPSNTYTFQHYIAYNCNLGYIDFTTLPNMTMINGCEILLHNNNMTAEEVNHILVDLDTISIAGYTGRTINIGGSNASPDTNSGGYNGVAAKTSLQGKGFTVTTS